MIDMRGLLLLSQACRAKVLIVSELSTHCFDVVIKMMSALFFIRLCC